MRAIIYTRVSTEDQGDNNSLPTQLAAGRRYAEQHGMGVVAELSDTMSGSVLDRPGLTKVRQIVNAGGADALIVYSQDRLTRSVAHMLLLRDELKAARVTLHAVSRGQSADTPEGRLFDTIEASFSEYERLKIKERMARGKRGKLEAGNILGQGDTAPYGYRFVGSKRERRLELIEGEAEIVRRIYRWYLEDGATVRSIRDRLDAAGQPTPGATRARSERHFIGTSHATARSQRWGHATVASILRSTTYRGEFLYKSHGISVPVPAIIDAATWNAVQAKLDAGRQRSLRNSKRTYLLRGLLKCCCGYALVGQAAHRRHGAVDRYYRCGSRRMDAARPCDTRAYYRAELLEEAVWAWVVDEVLDEDRIIAGITAQRDTLAERRAALEAERASYQRQIDGAADQVTKLTQLFAADVLTLEEVAAQKRAIDAARASAQGELDRVEAELQRTGPAAEDVAEVTRLAREIRASLECGVSDATKMRVLALLDVRGVIVQDAAGGVALDVQASLTADTGRVAIVSAPC